jgi:glycine/D-amino acid oxidase-like deaminating enzyme
MGYSPDGFPFVGEVPDQENVFVAASFQGHGMVLSFLAAKALTTMMAKDHSGLESWFPQVFCVTPGRMAKRFKGRLHTDAKALELNAQ